MEAVCAGVAKQIDQQTFWMKARDKPCWSNIRVKIGQLLANQLTLSKGFESYEIIASPAWQMGSHGTGPKWKNNTCFSLHGDGVKQFVTSLGNSGLAKYLWRLYAIRSLAAALSTNETVRRMISKLSAATSAGQLNYDWLEEWVKEFKGYVGRGWGPTTVHHALTDLGVSLKPDIHVTRSCVRIGLIPGVDKQMDQREVDARWAKLVPQVIRNLMELSKHVSPVAVPDARSSLREIDKVLMEWSRQGLARPL